jgi:hypothetical protein
MSIKRQNVEREILEQLADMVEDAVEEKERIVKLEVVAAKIANEYEKQYWEWVESEMANDFNDFDSLDYIP